MEIITGVERRRRWRVADKLRIVAELEQPGACFADVARRHKVSRGLLWNWRRQVQSGTLAPGTDLQFRQCRLWPMCPRRSRRLPAERHRRVSSRRRPTRRSRSHFWTARRFGSGGMS
ncbi:MAG: transposase, partial [Acetobacteraceae bacterium]|nr:transposase [Acetobacteraceae bacterium]